MKKITSVLLGLSLTLATAGLSLAAQTAAPATGNSTPVAKKHVKKNEENHQEHGRNTGSYPGSGREVIEFRLHLPVRRKDRRRRA